MKKRRPVLGQFSKGTSGSLSINFAASAGKNCDIGCVVHPDHTNRSEGDPVCYAVRAEKRPDRSQLAAKLIRHGRRPAGLVCGQALHELQTIHRKGISIPWVRISTAGSVPQPKDVDDLFRTQFRALLSWCRQHEIPVHIPIETAVKARFYRAIVKDLAVVRESAQHAQRFLRATYPASVVCGTGTRRERVTLCAELARRKREKTGRRCIVCPAVTNSWASQRNKAIKNDRAKCGICTACAEVNTDIIYPTH